MKVKIPYENLENVKHLIDSTIEANKNNNTELGLILYTSRTKDFDYVIVEKEKSKKVSLD